MKNKILLAVVVLVLALAIGVQPAMAQDTAPVCDDPPCVYVDPGRTAGNEDGTAANPYNNTTEGYNYAYAQTDGAWVFTRNSDGTWSKIYVYGATSGGTGLPIAKTTLYIIVASLVVVLILAGLTLQRRSRQQALA